MNVIVPAKISEDPELASGVEAASTLLENVLGPSASALVRAEWSLSEDANSRALINLTVSDWTGSVGYRFSPEELKNPAHMRVRLQRLWGDLLQVRSHVQLDKNWWLLQGQGEH